VGCGPGRECAKLSNAEVSEVQHGHRGFGTIEGTFANTMPALTIDDFKPFSVTCELRYKNAFLIYDRTGQVLQDIKNNFTNIAVTSGSPQQTAWVAEEGSFTLELGACRFTANRLDKNGESFAKHCEVFFDAVATQMEIGVFTRIGLRYIARRECKSLDEAKTAIASMSLANLKPTRRFNSSDSPTEILFRWEDKEIGAFVRLKAETAEIKLSAPPEMSEYVPKIDKEISFVTLDVDYYTVAPVEREQWNPLEWVPQKLRTIRKESDGILLGSK